MKFHQLGYQKEYVLPVATTTTIGGIAVDGDLFKSMLPTDIRCELLL